MENTDFGQKDEQYQMIRPFLHDGEMILWSGKPYTGVRYRPPFFYTVFAVFWLSFALFWTVSVGLLGGWFALFGIPFVLIGIFINYSAFFGMRNRYRHTVYVLTETRALILIEKKNGTVCREYILSRLSTVRLSAVRGDSGTIDFSQLSWDHMDRYDRRSMTNDARFEMIEHVQSVYRMISDRISRNEEI